MSLRYLPLALLTLAPAALAQPDFAVVALSAEPDAVPVGEPVAFAYTLCNLGSVGAPATAVGFFLSEDAVYSRPVDRLIDDHEAPALAAGACTTEILETTIPMDVDPGDYTLFGVADYDDALAEPDEDNNVIGVPFTVEGVLVPPIDVTLTPHGPPVTIPDGGGAFAFDVLIANLSMTSETFDVWAEVIRPGGQIFRHPRFGPIRLTLAPGETAGPATFRQRVPAAVPPGVYFFRVSAGTFPGETIDAESFEVAVLGSEGRLAAVLAGWTVEQVAGPPLAGHATESAGAGAVQASPNPARGATTVAFDLTEGAEVRLDVYDLLGRVVLSLPAEALPAGPHALRLDVSGLPAGTYLYRLEAGDPAATTGRLTVVP